jgi:hypothetical protein
MERLFKNCHFCTVWDDSTEVFHKIGYKNIILQGEPVISKIPCGNSTNTWTDIVFDEQREQYLSMETTISEII